ncbi:MAG: tyrosine-type recombinase/integrase [Pseudorhodoplanes sp.]|nr:tyrosine-type recombinase/integrase [Pseudorhodoplanes sp.]
MYLSDLAVRKAAPRERPYKLSDGGGLHILVRPNGTKSWQMKYRFAGKEKLLSFGTYPMVKLAEARGRRDQAKKLLLNLVDPGEQRKQAKAAAVMTANNTFGAIAAEYLANKQESDAAASTMSKNRWLLEELAAPLASRPITQITAAEILQLLKRIEKSGRRETARRLRGMIGSVYRYAIVTLRATGDPTTATHGALLAPKVTPRAAIVDEKALGGLMRAIDDYDGWPTVTAAMKFTALTFARPGEVRGAKRREIDFENAVWHIAAERTKMRRPHDVPLSPQAIQLLRDIWPLSEHAELIFPSIRSNRKPLSDMAMNAALRRMGYGKDEMTAHGFRATASTILNSRGYNPDVIESALGHLDDNEIRRVYNRAKYWPEREKLMADWANLLDEFRALR